MTKLESIEKLRAALSYAAAKNKIDQENERVSDEKIDNNFKILKLEKLRKRLLIFMLVITVPCIISFFICIVRLQFFSALFPLAFNGVIMLVITLVIGKKIKGLEEENTRLWEAFKQEKAKFDQKCSAPQLKASKAAYEELFPSAGYSGNDVRAMISALENNEADSLKEAIRILKSKKHMDYVEEKVTQASEDARAARVAAEQARDNPTVIERTYYVGRD